jgi:HEPN domain-containing protein
MPHSKTAEVRRFLTVAKQRFEEAQLLNQFDRQTVAVYLAGYAVECSLKALLLSAATDRQFRSLMTSFRGKAGHEFEWLKAKYVKRGGAPFPPEIAKAFTAVSHWTTDLRYKTGLTPPREADLFLRSAEEIIRWATKRL